MKKELDLQKILEIIRKVVKQDTGQEIMLHEPCFRGNEWRYIRECLDSGWVSSAGGFVDRFEKDLARFTGARHAVAVVNGTAALHIALLLLDVNAGDEVLLPALTFVATANAVSYCRAIPHFVDSDMRTMGIDSEKLADYLGYMAEIKNGTCYNKRSGKRIKAIIPVHIFGHPVDMDPLLDIAGHYHLQVVEDAAESLGSTYKGRHTGTLGRIGIMSFNGNKIVSTGGGGAILSNDDVLAKMARHLTTTARITRTWGFEHDRVGYNYRLPNINAALGCAQLEQLPRFVAAKRCLAQAYGEAFKDLQGVDIFTEGDNVNSNYWLNALLLNQEYAMQKDALLQLSNEAGVITRPVWELMHRLLMYRDCPRMDLSTAENLFDRIINLPSSAFLGEHYV
ncbi:MAG: LegC family aminotransferase [Syntrophomonadaceae bacterium]|nr:LegC family aminotransferase [Syntrophomonadaceae bacterium]